MLNTDIHNINIINKMGRATWKSNLKQCVKRFFFFNFGNLLVNLKSRMMAKILKIIC